MQGNSNKIQAILLILLFTAKADIKWKIKETYELHLPWNTLYYWSSIFNDDFWYLHKWNFCIPTLINKSIKTLKSLTFHSICELILILVYVNVCTPSYIKFSILFFLSFFY